MLIGAELYFDIPQQGCTRLGNNLSILRNSHFGWLLSGVYSGDSDSESYVGFVSNEDLHGELAKFWRAEKVSLNNKENKEFLSSGYIIETRMQIHVERVIPILKSDVILGRFTDTQIIVLSAIIHKLTPGNVSPNKYKFVSKNTIPRF